MEQLCLSARVHAVYRGSIWKPFRHLLYSSKWLWVIAFCSPEEAEAVSVFVAICHCWSRVSCLASSLEAVHLSAGQSSQHALRLNVVSDILIRAISLVISCPWVFEQDVGSVYTVAPLMGWALGIGYRQFSLQLRDI